MVLYSHHAMTPISGGHTLRIVRSRMKNLRNLPGSPSNGSIHVGNDIIHRDVFLFLVCGGSI